MRSRRTDARRNRQTILRVADEAFAGECGVVPLAEIARRAGLGRATVYRHFPDRKALGTALAAQQLSALRRVVSAAEHDRRPVRDVFRAVLSDQVARRPLVQLFRELPAREQRRHADALIRVLTPAFHRAQVEGQLRDDVGPADLVLVFEMVEAALAARFSAGDPDPPADKLIEVLLDGLFGRLPE